MPSSLRVASSILYLSSSHCLFSLYLSLIPCNFCWKLPFWYKTVQNSTRFVNLPVCSPLGVTFWGYHFSSESWAGFGEILLISLDLMSRSIMFLQRNLIFGMRVGLHFMTRSVLLLGLPIVLVALCIFGLLSFLEIFYFYLSLKCLSEVLCGREEEKEKGEVKRRKDV